MKIKSTMIDVLYFILSSMITFIFLLSRTNGEIRGYVILFEIVGFLTFRAIFSKYIIVLITGFFCLVNRCFTAFEKHTTYIFRKIFEKAFKMNKITVYFIKKLLKNAKEVLYNKLVKICKKGVNL